MSLFNHGAKVILSTFQHDFDMLRRAPSGDQIDVGRRVFEDIQELSQLSTRQLAENQQQLREKYKQLRNLSLKLGAINELDPRYAYPALMESLILSIGDDGLFQQISQEIMNWLFLIGVIKRG